MNIVHHAPDAADAAAKQSSSASSSSLWVFGYGSLCWHPGFEHGASEVGHIEGFARRFYQGNTTHRGTEEKPGRVATLTEDKHSRTHGVAFQLLGESALSYLNNRECQLGGYKTHLTTFHPRKKDTPPFHVLLYMATPSNKHWMGPAPIVDIAEQVVSSTGNSGHNVEYVLRLAEWIRLHLPDTRDDHLFQLEAHVRRKIRERNLCLRRLMGQDGECPFRHDGRIDREGSEQSLDSLDSLDSDGEESEDTKHGGRSDGDEAEGAAGETGAEAAEAPAERAGTFAFAANVAEKKLRCLKL